MNTRDNIKKEENTEQTIPHRREEKEFQVDGEGTPQQIHCPILQAFQIGDVRMFWKKFLQENVIDRTWCIKIF